MATESEPVLSGTPIEIPHARYAADLELHDRFLGMSSELLRLALGGLAVSGAFLSILTAKDTRKEVVDVLTAGYFWWLMAWSMALFAVSVGSALVHRFLASDGMYHHIQP